MAALSHEPLTSPKTSSTLVAVLGLTQMWASLAIVVIWLAVLFSAIYGADIVDRGVPGDISTVPSGVAVALFASIATWPVAKYGLRNDAR